MPTESWGDAFARAKNLPPEGGRIELPDGSVIEVRPVTPEFVDAGYQAAFGETRGDAQAKRLCVVCKQPPTFSTEAGRREYEISGVCEPCFDKMFDEEA